MTTASEGQELTRVGPGTPMGELMREYWLPAVKSSELVAGGDPVRLMLLGEKLIAFRDTTGRVGVMDHRCPHRCASLFYGRNEEGGMRCVYHGWKFAADGQCLEMPNLPPEQDFSAKVRAKAYQVTERAGVIWVYMGARDDGAADAGDRGDAAAGQRALLNFTQRECNWLQALEGDIDTSHFSLAACRLGAAGAGRCGQLAAIPGESIARPSIRSAIPTGARCIARSARRRWQDLLAVRPFRLPVLDVHSAGRISRIG